VGEFVKVGRRAEFREGRGRAVTVGGRRVAVFRVGERWRALQDRCPHMGASLAEGRIESGVVTCHWHGWRFELETGRGAPPARPWACARPYEVRVDGEDVWIRCPDEPPAADSGEEEWVAWDDAFLGPPSRAES
jgi:nitrite reductase (NADH) small subunit/3-phenylpropionate/trans-cinnamate dioxygenase ferredoxin subunit